MFNDLWQTLPDPMQVQLARYAIGFWRLLPGLVMAGVFLLLVWAVVRLVNRLLPRLLGRAHMRRAMVDVVAMLLTVGLWLLGALIAVTLVFPTVTPAKAVAALGIGGVAIGFAFRDVFENFLAGILILIREPFRVSDFIESQGIEGQVELITIRDTHIRQTDGQLVVAPNSILFKNPVTIRTAEALRRTTIAARVAYDADLDLARAVIAEAVRQVDSVRDDVHDVQIFARELAESGVEFEVTWWTGSRPVDIRTSRDKVVAAVKAALDAAGIEIPVPQRALSFRQPLTTAPLDDTD
jgi:small-conductance mechanosensitive channel